MTWWWLSFCDVARPKGTQFLGGCVVAAHDMISAVRVSHALGINPGGEVQGREIEHVPPPEYRERLLARDTIAEMERAMEGASS